MTAALVVIALALAVIVILAIRPRAWDPRLSKTWKGGDE